MITTTTLALILTFVSLRQIRHIRTGRRQTRMMGLRLERAAKPNRRRNGVELFHRRPAAAANRVVFLPVRA